jgi:glycosyltransferase involved in cell wall biosynthesis
MSAVSSTPGVVAPASRAGISEPRRVVMVVFNDLVHDARVFKEAMTLDEAGYKVEVIGMCDAESAPVDGWGRIPTTRLPVGPSRSLRIRYGRFWRGCYAALTKARPDAIHAHDLDVLPPAWLAAKRLGVPLVHDAHELWTELPSLVGRPLIRSVWSLLARTFVPRCDAVITVSDGIAGVLSDRYHLSACVLRNCPTKAERHEPARLREKLAIPPGSAILIFQGGLLQGLGVERAIDVMPHLPECYLVVVGDGPLKGELVHRADCSMARERIKFVPAVPFADLPPITMAADIGLHLGESDGLNTRLALPNKLFEYVAAGVPVVATGWPEIGKVIARYRVGLTVPPRASVEQTAQCVREVLSERDKFAANARVAANELVWENEAPRLVECYAGLPWIDRGGASDGTAIAAGADG